MRSRHRLGVAATAALIWFPVLGQAGPYTDFEADLRDAYGDYRTALFQSNAGNVGATTKALTSLSEEWASLESRWGANPPPQYENDPAFSDTLKAINALVAAARSNAGKGDLTTTHEELEGIRERVGDLHLRNGLYTFSDRMNAYHAEMEKALAAGVPVDGDLTPLVEEAAVLRYLAEDIDAHPAPEASDPAYASLVDGLVKSVAAVQSAAGSGDPAAAKAAMGNLKAPYAKLFAKFG